MTARVDNIPCICGDEECIIPFGICHCGCGLEVNISKKNHVKSGSVQGRPYKFRMGHHETPEVLVRGVCICQDRSCTIPFGYCHCGCGEKTSIPNYTKTSLFIKKGQPARFILGHGMRAKNPLPKGMCVCRKENCQIPYGYCHCGCGKKTNIPSHTDSGSNTYKGVPLKYATGHRETKSNSWGTRRKKYAKLQVPEGYKVCRDCKIEKPMGEFSQDLRMKDKRSIYCSECNSSRKATYYAEHPEKAEEKRVKYSDPVYIEKMKWARIFNTYGITKEEYKSMLSAQRDVCAICGRSNSQKNKGMLHVDHCHKTGKIRGLLCHNCNVSIGLLADDPAIFRRAIKYIMKGDANQYMFE